MILGAYVAIIWEVITDYSILGLYLFKLFRDKQSKLKVKKNLVMKHMHSC